VRGLARLISSAISNCAKIGPDMKRKERLPWSSCSITSEPRMSDGIRSGVNWMRRESRPSTMPSVSTNLVLARPGTPTSSAWPPAKSATRVRSTTLSWPKMTRPTPARILAMSASARSAAAIISLSLIAVSLIITLMRAGSFFWRGA
jgi:hypothetical protein